MRKVPLSTLLVLNQIVARRIGSHSHILQRFFPRLVPWGHLISAEPVLSVLLEDQLRFSLVPPEFLMNCKLSSD